MATKPLIQLNAAELIAALDGVGTAELVAPEGTSHVRLSRWRGRTSPDSVPGTDWVVLEDPYFGPLCVLPTDGLSAGRAALVTGWAAGLLLPPGAVSVAILGSGPALQPLLVVCCRQLPGVWRIVWCPGGHVDSALLDRLDLAGIRFTVAAVLDETVNLVVVLDHSADIGRPRAGAVVVNAAGPAWSAEAGTVDRVCGGVELRQVLTGAAPGRTAPDQVILVELLGCAWLDVRLARLLHRVALDRALGTRLPG